MGGWIVTTRGCESSGVTSVRSGRPGSSVPGHWTIVTTKGMLRDPDSHWASAKARDLKHHHPARGCNDEANACESTEGVMPCPIGTASGQGLASRLRKPKTGNDRRQPVLVDQGQLTCDRCLRDGQSGSGRGRDKQGEELRGIQEAAHGIGNRLLTVIDQPILDAFEECDAK